MGRYVELSRGATLLTASLGLTTLTMSPVAGQDPEEDSTVTVRGQVLDAITRLPLQGVRVRMAAVGVEVPTDSLGWFQIRNLPTGDYELSLSYDGYEEVSGKLEVVQDGSFVIELVPLPTVAPVSGGRLVGRVVDADGGEPLVGAEVRLPDSSRRTVTNADGEFAFPGLAPGGYPVEFSSSGYTTVTDTITVEMDRTSHVQVQLPVDAISLEPIEVRVERREIALETAGFYERREEGWGRFIDLEDIERENPSEVTDLFSGMSGVTLLGDGRQPLERYVLLRGGRSASFGGGSAYCFPTVVIDGTIVHRAGSRPGRIDHLISASSIAGIEVYPSSTGVPMQYAGTGSSCGVILIWTRR